MQHRAKVRRDRCRQPRLLAQISYVNIRKSSVRPARLVSGHLQGKSCLYHTVHNITDNMDKGAARSRKRLEQLAKAETSISAGDNPLLKRLAEGESRDAGRDGRGGHRGGGRGGGSGSGGRGGAGGRGGFQRRDGSRPFRPGQDTSAQEGEATGSGTGSSRPERPKKKEMLDEAVRYKPKAIRSSAALIWSEGAFEVPPSVERMEGVRRVDLSGSGVTDVSWVKGGVTWLSLAGCPVEKGWEAIGELKELSGKLTQPSGSLRRKWSMV